MKQQDHRLLNIPESVLNKINLYLDELSKNNIKVRKAILFGSYAKGNYNEWSDIDIAVVSDSFEGYLFKDKEKNRGLYSRVDLRLSILPLNSTSLNSFFIQSEIVKKGANILKKNIIQHLL